MKNPKVLFSVVFVLILVSNTNAQETKTIFGGDTQLSFAWGLGMKVNSIQDDTGTLFEIYAGALVNNSIIIALAGGMNIGHPKVNYGYFGLLSQYTFKPKELIHFSGQVLLATGSTKDYEQEKSSTFDNYGNISGPGFFLIEPSINAELNLSVKSKLYLGLGYRIATGLDEDHELISKTKVTNKDLSGLNLLIGVKFALYK